MNLTIAAIQQRLKDDGFLTDAIDGVWGPKSQAALNAAIAGRNADGVLTHHGLASSFADESDVRAFRLCKQRGGTDEQCFKVGDNGIGCYGDDVTDLAIPYVAVPPDDMIAKFGTTQAAKHMHVLLTIDGLTQSCVVGDRMPWKKHITNGAVIDLAPGAQKIFNLKAPFMVPCKWQWT